MNDLVLISRQDYLQYLNNDLKEISKFLYSYQYNNTLDVYYDSLLIKRNKINDKIKELTI